MNPGVVLYKFMGKEVPYSDIPIGSNLEIIGIVMPDLSIKRTVIKIGKKK